MSTDIPQDAGNKFPSVTSAGLSGTPAASNTRAADSVDVSVRRNYLWLSGLIVFCAAGIDQLTKLWAVRELTGQAPLPALGEFLRFTLVYNEGGAMGTNFGGALYYLIIGIAILLVIIYYLWIYRFSLRYSIPLALIASGAVGNLIDRIRLGKVVDWIDVDFFNINLFGYQLERWWTFNIADASITLALVYMVWAVFSAPDARGDAGETGNIADPIGTDDSNQPRAGSDIIKSVSISGATHVPGNDPAKSDKP